MDNYKHKDQRQVDYKHKDPLLDKHLILLAHKRLTLLMHVEDIQQMLNSQAHILLTHVEHIQRMVNSQAHIQRMDRRHLRIKQVIDSRLHIKQDIHLRIKRQQLIKRLRDCLLYTSPSPRD